MAAGGTAGHLAPALAVADELRSRGHHVSFATSRGRGDESRVAARGFDAHSFAISGLPRRPGIAQLRAVARAVLAVGVSIRLVRAVRPDAVLAGGGFVSTPVAIAARLGRVPVIVTEADAHLGLANRMSARSATLLCTAYPLAERRYRQLVTGRPVDPGFVDRPRTPARQALGIPVDARVLAVVGGSGGATRLNCAAADAWQGDMDPRAGGEPIHILHVAGRRDYPALAETAPASDRYRLLEYCDAMPDLLAAADLVVSRAGGSAFELAAVGRATVFVPFPFATGDHQTRNAAYFVEHGAALVVSDDRLDGACLRDLGERLLAPSGDVERTALERRVRELARPDAAAVVAAVVEQAGAAHARRVAGGGRP